MIMVARAQKGTLTVGQLRNLAQLRIAAKGGALVAAGATTVNAKKAAAGVKKSGAAVARTTGNATQKGRTAGAGNSQSKTLAQKRARTQQKTKSRQEVVADLESSAPKKATTETGTTAVSPSRLDNQVTGPLAKRVEAAKGGKPAAQGNANPSASASAKKPYTPMETRQGKQVVQGDLMAAPRTSKIEYLGASPEGDGVEILVQTSQGQTFAALSHEDLKILLQGDTIDFGSFTCDKSTIRFLQDASRASSPIKANLQAAQKAIQKPGFFGRLFSKPKEPVKIADPAKSYETARNGGAVELNENELVRFKGNGGRSVNENYIQASKDARKYMIDAVESGEYTGSTDSYIETMNEMHEISASGMHGNISWYEQAGEGAMNVRPGKIRVGGRAKSSRPQQAKRVEEIAKQYGDSFKITKNSKVNLEGIPADNLPLNTNIEGTFYHLYPKGGNNLRPYYEQMQRTAKEAVALINRQAPEKEILGKIAEHYQYAANARPYYQINNSLFMNEVNTLLQKAGLRPIPHGELDIAAMHLQPSAFKQYFVDMYYKTRL